MKATSDRMACRVLHERDATKMSDAHRRYTGQHHLSPFFFSITIDCAMKKSPEGITQTQPDAGSNSNVPKSAAADVQMN